MAWIAISPGSGRRVAARGADGAPWPGDGGAAGAVLARGSLVIETRLPTSRVPRPLVFCDRPGPRPFHLSLQAIPGGGLTLVLAQGGDIVHRAVNPSEAGRTDLLRITYCWDAAAGLGRLALERSDRDKVLLSTLTRPPPMRLDDLRALMRDDTARHVAPEVLYLALSDAIEPVGPMPSLLPDTPVATPAGYRRIGEIRRGDLVLTPDGDAVPVLHRLSRRVPACGGFAPVRLRASYFGLRQDITVAPSQRLVLSGSDVEYLFNQEAVLVEARHLVGGFAAMSASAGPTVTYTQLLLPEHEALIAAGCVAETLFVGRLRRHQDLLGASILNRLDRHRLPEHRRPVHPVLRAFEAIVLAESRAA